MNAIEGHEDMRAYLNGVPISIPQHDAGESIDICSKCLRTFVVTDKGIDAITSSCQESYCIFATDAEQVAEALK